MSCHQGTFKQTLTSVWVIKWPTQWSPASVSSAERVWARFRGSLKYFSPFWQLAEHWGAEQFARISNKQSFMASTNSCQSFYLYNGRYGLLLGLHIPLNCSRVLTSQTASIRPPLQHCLLPEITGGFIHCHPDRHQRPSATDNE